jgi:hypothetical protein
MHFIPENFIGELMVPPESAPQELSNEWSCRYVLIILNFLGNFCVPPLVTEVAHQSEFWTSGDICHLWTKYFLKKHFLVVSTVLGWIHCEGSFHKTYVASLQWDFNLCYWPILATVNREIFASILFLRFSQMRCKTRT